MALPDCAAFERAGLKAWPAIELDWDGAWLRRAANGYTKRANSLQCFDPADNDNAAERLAAGKAWYVERGIAPVIRTTPLQSSALSSCLDAQGWIGIDASHLYAMPLHAHEGEAEGRITDPLDPVFLAAQQRLQHYSDDIADRFSRLLRVIAVPAAGVLIFRDGAVVASGLMAIADGIVIAGNVVTDTRRRRQGLGAAMMRSGLAWAHAQGARIAALNVQADNAAAKSLYARLGYVHQYDYSYRIPKDAR
ncbi:GNAT family N-acetyltransferase [Devosia faecipullorum]|uniref:GNAT family N-acetyltransferase n=1 Tax=Devosia faecipullorum TaxID=2755039 RepID=UPI00187B7A8F|nr:GNAT family N-acetyltransferase [Devosia faecipullorum]MBE7732973.1 GNAT family N-acetyltransferase [Devosia faecipullorum]